MIAAMIFALTLSPTLCRGQFIQGPCFDATSNQIDYADRDLHPPSRREYLNAQMNQIANLVCHERMTRYRRRGAAPAKWFDSIDADVRVLGESEEYSEIYLQRPSRKDVKRYNSVADLPGPWQSGELAQLFRIARDEIEFQRPPAVEDNTDGEPAFVMEFTVPAYERKWSMAVNSSVYFLSFKMSIWFSRQTGNVLRTSWLASAAELPGDAGIRAIAWDVHFRQATIGGVSSTVPLHSVYTVYYTEGHRRDWVETEFSNFQRFGSETQVRFE